ncbi:MAG: hypothetical protein U1E65_18645 [Myxococcota bacterium]
MATPTPTATPSPTATTASVVEDIERPEDLVTAYIEDCAHFAPDPDFLEQEEGRMYAIAPQRSALTTCEVPELRYEVMGDSIDEFNCNRDRVDCINKRCDCLSCQVRISNDCVACKARCGQEPRCIRDCATARAEAQRPCRDALAECRSSACEAEVDACLRSGRKVARETCGSVCAKIYACATSSAGFTYADCWERFPKVPSDCRSWCLYTPPTETATAD